MVDNLFDLFEMTEDEYYDWTSSMDADFKVAQVEEEDIDGTFNSKYVMYTDGDGGVALFNISPDTGGVQITMDSKWIDIDPKTMIKIMKEFK